MTIHHKFYNFKEVCPQFPVEVSRYIISFLPIYDRFYLSDHFVTDLESQLVECRNDRNYIHKYVSYYDNIRPSVVSQLTLPWVKIEPHVEHFEIFGQSMTYSHADEYRFTLNNLVYSIEFNPYEQDYDDSYYRQVDLCIDRVGGGFFSSEQFENIETVFYEKRIKIGDIYCTLNHYVSELMPFSCDIDIDPNEFMITLFVNAPYINYARDEDEFYEYWGKNKILQISDQIMSLLYTHIFKRINKKN